MPSNKPPLGGAYPSAHPIIAIRTTAFSPCVLWLSSGTTQSSSARLWTPVTVTALPPSSSYFPTTPLPPQDPHRLITSPSSAHPKCDLVPSSSATLCFNQLNPPTRLLINLPAHYLLPFPEHQRRLRKDLGLSPPPSTASPIILFLVASSPSLDAGHFYPRSLVGLWRHSNGIAYGTFLLTAYSLIDTICART
ncbi:hypothetical protein DFS34DRAFT_644200 [Phlyctochytrium arcticum]|nr:hypothetical protein DFS34DRAFT_644200 [Phlyctochytrium arcticum]